VGVLLGRGDGTFQSVPGYNGGSHQFEQNLATGDFNGDSRLDLAVANYDSIGLLSGKADGSFSLLSTADAGYYPWAVAVGDLNNDGEADVAVANYCNPSGCSTGLLTVRLGNGDGTFRPAKVYGSGRDPWSIALGDFNRDGKLDVVVAGDSLTIYLGHGDGTFDLVGSYSPGGYGEESVVVADLNGDAKLDLAVSNLCVDYPCRSGASAILLGNGDGTFRAAVTYDTGGYTQNVAVSDVNGDGKLDLAVTNRYGGLVRVFLGKGDGTFPVSSDYNIGRTAFAVGFQDFDGDGKQDMLVTSDEGTSLLLGRGDGTFESQTDYPVAGYQITTGDFNGDGKPDVALQGGDVFILLNMGKLHTTTTLASSPNPSHNGEEAMFTATVSGTGAYPTGVVKFNDGKKLLGTGTLNSGVVTFASSTLSIGKHSVTAVYSGDTNYSGSTSAVLKQVVLVPPSASSTVVTTSGSPSHVKEAVTFTAIVTSPDGQIPDGEPVTFSDGSIVLASVPLASGIASYSTSELKVKTHTVRAKYAGDATFKPSTGALQQIVLKYSTTITLTSNPNPSHYGQAVTFTATVTGAGPSPAGKVWFKDGTTGIGYLALNGGVATLTKSKLAIGTHSITAQYLGDGASAKSTSSILNQVVQ
jgi:hypothetical protein